MHVLRILDQCLVALIYRIVKTWQWASKQHHSDTWMPLPSSRFTSSAAAAGSVRARALWWVWELVARHHLYCHPSWCEVSCGGKCGQIWKVVTGWWSAWLVGAFGVTRRDGCKGTIKTSTAVEEEQGYRKVLRFELFAMCKLNYCAKIKYLLTCLETKKYLFKICFFLVSTWL